MEQQETHNNEQISRRAFLSDLGKNAAKLSIVPGLLAATSDSVFADKKKTIETKILEFMEKNMLGKADPFRNTGKTKLDLMKERAKEEGRLNADGSITIYLQVAYKDNDYPAYYKKVPFGLSDYDKGRYQELVEHRKPLNSIFNKKEQKMFKKAIEETISALKPWFHIETTIPPGKEPTLVIGGNDSPKKITQRINGKIVKKYADALSINLDKAVRPFQSDILFYEKEIREDILKHNYQDSLTETVAHELLHALAGYIHIQEKTRAFVYHLTVMDSISPALQEKFGLLSDQVLGLADIETLENAFNLKAINLKKNPTINLGSKKVTIIDASDKNDTVTFALDKKGPQRAIVKLGEHAHGMRSDKKEGKMSTFKPAAYVNKDGPIETAITLVARNKILQLDLLEKNSTVISEKGNVRLVLKSYEKGTDTFKDTGKSDQLTKNFWQKYTQSKGKEDYQKNGDVVTFLPSLQKASAKKNGNDLHITYQYKGGKERNFVIEDQFKPGTKGLDSLAIYKKGVIAGKSLKNVNVINLFFKKVLQQHQKLEDNNRSYQQHIYSPDAGQQR